MDLLFRIPFLWSMRLFGRMPNLIDRMNFTEVGFTGHVSMLDKKVAEERNLQPLSRFEKWLLRPIIDFERQRRRDALRQAVLDITGEDIYDY